MTQTSIEARAREMLAEEYERMPGSPSVAEAAIAALVRALTPAEADDATVERVALQAVYDAMLDGGDGQKGDFGWSITALNQARPLIRAALAAAPRPADEKLREGIEMAAKAVDREYDGRRNQYFAAKAAKKKFEARDFDTMAIAHAQSATAIRALAKQDGGGK